MNEQFFRHLKQHGYKRTSSRTKAFEALRDHGPASMSELLSLTQAASDRASVYRAVALFERIGILHHLIVGGRKVIELTEHFTGHHHHLACTACGATQAIHSEAIEATLASISRSHNFAAHGHIVEISGLCARCASRN